ncbi:MAG: DUF1116 domain-containing protein [Pelolinea sp.]|nr:DUF1116 domain-containing protein [Pelolinea sp.]
MEKGQISDIFEKPISVVNIGLQSMALSVRDQGIKVIDLEWKPPIDGVPFLFTTKDGIDIDEANEIVIQKIKQARPTLIGMGLAKDVIPNFHDHLFLHAGPPITWDRMCGPLRGNVMGALIYEGMANDEKDAEKIASSGDLEYAPCHHYQSVGPMAGVISPGLPVFIIENKTFGNLAFCSMNEGLGKVLRYGGMGPEVYERLKWMKSVLYPTLKRALDSLPNGLDIKALIAQALHMGDDGHNRNRAGTSLFLRVLLPSLARTNQDNETLAQVVEFIDKNDHFFLNITMPAGKAALDPTDSVKGSSIVTTMTRNGTDFGIRLASMPKRWFTAPAPFVEGLYFPGFGPEDANPDIGDSTVTETAGYGGFAMAAAPAITKFVGGTPQDAIDSTLEMYEITASEHEGFTIPVLNFRGTPLGIDVRKVMQTGILPKINTGIAHKQPGIGGIGAGITRAPMKVFIDAFEALRELS